MTSALEGLRVVELGDFISAAYCTKLLADLGADVVKIEPPEGDSTRSHGPFHGDIPDRDASGLYIYLNTNKRGIGLDMRKADGRDIFDRLLDRVDVLVENLGTEQLDTFGFDATALRERHPRLIVTSISVFGREGPHKHYRGHGLQASAGSSVAFRTGDPARSPLAKPLNEPEFLGGLHAAAATLVAVLAYEQSAEAQHIDISIQDILASVTSGPAIANALYGTRAAGTRNGHRVNAFFPWTVLPVADGYMEFITMQERHWRHFMEYLGNPDWANDERFKDIYSRVPHAAEIEAHLVSAVGDKTRAELWAVCREIGVSFQPVNRISDLADADQLRYRGYFQETVDGHGKRVVVPGAPYKLSASPWELRTPAPRQGEHTVEVLRETLGLSPLEVADLCRVGAIY